MFRLDPHRCALALALLLLPAAAVAQEENHDGLAVEWIHRTAGICGTVATGDLDGDGDVDLAIEEERSAAVSLWWNDGRARFPARDSLLPGHAYTTFATLDADADGRLDLAVGGAQLSVHRGLGGGQFAPVVIADLAGVVALAVADLNADTRPDLVVLSHTPAPRVQGWLNAGAGGFTPAAPTSLADPLQLLIAADFDGDGRQDVACAGFNTSVQILRGDGQGGFVPLSRFERLQDGVRELVAIDQDGDGDPDLLSSDSFGTIGIHFNDGAGHFTTTFWDPAGSRRGTGLGVVDMNRDGRPEVFVAVSLRFGVDMSLLRFTPAHDPGFAHAVRYSYLHRFFGSSPEAPRSVIGADLDGDEQPDLVVVSPNGPDAGAPVRNGQIGIIRGRPDGSIGAMVLRPASVLEPPGGSAAPAGAAPVAGPAAMPALPPGEVLVSGDLDGDHRPETVIAGAGGTVLIAWSGPQEAFRRVTDTGLTAQGLVFAIANVTGGQAGELVAVRGEPIDGSFASDTAQIIVYKATRGTLRPRFESRIPGRTDRFDRLREVTAGDVDSDGDVDLALLWGPFVSVGRMQVVRNQAGRAFVADPEAYIFGSEHPIDLTLADLDGDQDLDATTVANIEGMIGRLQIRWNDGTGGFAELWQRLISGHYARSLEVRDLDGDGANDIVVGCVTFEGGPDAVAVVFGDWRSESRRLHGGRGIAPASATPSAPPLALGSVWPNPARSTLAIRFTAPAADRATLELFDLAGRRVMSEALRIDEAATHEHRLRLPSGLRTGVYWLSLRQGRAVTRSKVVIAR